MKNCGKTGGKCLKLVSKLRESPGLSRVVKRGCEICGLFNVKKKSELLVARKGKEGRICFPQGKIRNRMWVEEIGNDGFYAEYCQP